MITPLTAIIEEQVYTSRASCLLLFHFHAQVLSFSAKGLSTGYVTGKSSDAVLAGVTSGNYQLIFFTPELLIDKKKWSSKEMYMHQD